MERTIMAESGKSFGEIHFGGVDLGDARRDERLPQLVDEMHRHPGGTLPQKLPDSADRDSFYRLCDAEDVTREAVIKPHRERTLQYLQTADHFVLAIHDATELDFTTHSTLVDDLGQIGNGNQRGYLVQNTLVVDPQRGTAIGLANQIPHVRAWVKKGEKQSQRRQRKSRESLLWLKGPKDLPARREVVDVCDRGADTFEFLEHEKHSGRTFVIRSTHDRKIRVGHDADGQQEHLHEYARTLAELGATERAVAQKVIVNRPKRKGKKTRTIRTKRLARLNISAGPVQIGAPTSKNGNHGNDALPVWIIRVWELNPPSGEKALEWLLLTNHPITSVKEALQVIAWYESRWIIEELHKAKKTGCSIESLQFHKVERLQPAIGILSILALALLQLRDAARNPKTCDRPAHETIDDEYLEVLSLWRHRKYCPRWTVHEFYMSLARLGGHPGRKSSPAPGWIVLWRGWEKLQLMIDGARAIALRHQLKQNKNPKRCA